MTTEIMKDIDKKTKEYETFLSNKYFQEQMSAITNAMKGNKFRHTVTGALFIIEHPEIMEKDG